MDPRSRGSLSKAEETDFRAAIAYHPETKGRVVRLFSGFPGAVSSVLLAERSGKQFPIDYVSRTLHEAEQNYARIEKLAVCLLHTSRRLRRYFEAHPIKFITDQPVREVLYKPEASRKLVKYALELGAYNVTYAPRNAIKGQVLADFLTEVPIGEEETYRQRKHM